ncbi:ribosomal protein S35 [Pseudoscourfieldia marina]
MASMASLTTAFVRRFRILSSPFLYTHPCRGFASSPPPPEGGGGGGGSSLASQASQADSSAGSHDADASPVSQDSSSGGGGGGDSAGSASPANDGGATVGGNTSQDGGGFGLGGFGGGGPTAPIKGLRGKNIYPLPDSFGPEGRMYPYRDYPERDPETGKRRRPANVPLHAAGSWGEAWEQATKFSEDVFPEYEKENPWEFVDDMRKRLDEEDTPGKQLTREAAALSRAGVLTCEPISHLMLAVAKDGADDVESAPPVVRSHLPPYNTTMRWLTTVVIPSGYDPPNHPLNRKAKLSVKLSTLAQAARLDERQTMALRAIVGRRYDPQTDDFTVSVAKYTRREDNRREALRMVRDLVREARAL